MHTSVVICTRNRPDLIGNAVTSVLRNAYATFDVVVVDQSDDERTGDVVRAIAAEYTNLRYIYTNIPGLSRAYNIGVRETKGEILAFTDDDCIAAPDWISSIAAAFASNPDVDLLYGQVLLPTALASRANDVPTLPIPRPRRLTRDDGLVLYGMGANFAARRALFARIGGFDEVLGGGGPLKSSQDFDLQYRAYIAGVTTLLCPEARVDHYGLRTEEQWPGTVRAYGVGNGAFLAKHIRCGDFLALRLLLGQVARLAAREVLRGLRIRPRKWSRADYLRAYLEGVRESLRYPVDHQHRLYVARAHASQGSA